MDVKTLSEAMGGTLSLARYQQLLPAFEASMRAAGINTALRAAHYCAQLGHESVGLKYQSEIWGPTAVQRGYEGRRDLGNTQPGDGSRFRGHGWIQITGRHNHTEVSKWAHSRGLVPTATFFVTSPEKLGNDEYAGIGPAWYWTVARPQLNSLCDADNLEAVTRAINGGTNGLADRRTRLARCKAMGNRLLPSAGGSGAPVSALQPNPGHRGDPTFLPRLLRQWGLTVREMSGWSDWGVGDFEDIRGVVCHHTAGANTSPEFIARNPLLSNALSSQIHLARDGVVTLCGVGLAWHAGEFVAPPWATGYVTRNTASGRKSFTTANATTIGIEAVNAGDGSQPWPEVQMEAYATICAALCWYLGWSVDRVVAHKEGAPGRKIDPNFDMTAFRRRVGTKLANPPKGGAEEDDMFSDTDRLMLAEIRNQLTGSHKTKEFPGFKQLGGKTLVDAVAEIRTEMRLAGDQLSGPGRTDKGARTFGGWDLTSALEAVRRKGHAGVTLVEGLAVLLAGTDDDIAAVRRANKEEK